MFDIDDALDDGIDLEKLQFAAERAMFVLGQLGTKEAKYLIGPLENVVDEIEMYED